MKNLPKTFLEMFNNIEQYREQPNYKLRDLIEKIKG